MASLVTAIGAPVAGADPGDPSTSRLSVSSSGQQANNHSSEPSVSADGNLTAFSSLATNLVSGDTNGKRDVFVRDRVAGTTVRVSISTSGTQGNNISDAPALSADGRYVSYSSRATNLVSGDTNGVSDIFVRDRQTNTTTRVSISSTGVQATGASWLPAISEDGNYIAFYSTAANLVAGDTNGVADVFVHDRTTGATTRVSIASDGTQGNGSASFAPPALTQDGRYVAFASAATNLVAGDTNASDDVFLHDRTTGTTTRVSITSAGEEPNAGSGSPTVSSDGAHVAFWSAASNLSAFDLNDALDVFVHEIASGKTVRVSKPDSGIETDGASSQPAITPDGRYVFFQSDATNLVPSDQNLKTDVFVYDSETGATQRVSVSTAGTEGSGRSSDPAVSDDGRFVVFTSGASNLVTGDSNARDDIFLRDRGAAAAPSFVVLDNPSAGAKVFGTQTLAATVLPGFTATRVDFTVDGSVVASDSTQPFKAEWDTSTVADGDHQITAIAVAADNSTSESQPTTATVINEATCDEKLDEDRDEGLVSTDEYVLWGMYCAFEPSLLDERYDPPAQTMNVEGALFHVLRFWDDASQATQDEVATLLADIEAGLYTHPSGDIAQGGSVQPAGTLDCDLIVNRFQEPVEWCTYLTSDNHFSIRYEKINGDVEGQLPARIATLENSLRAALAKYTSSAIEQHPSVSSPLGYAFDTNEFPITIVLRPWFFSGYSTAPPPFLGEYDIFLDPHGSLYSDPRHELFHVIQFNYASLLDYTSRFGTSFWMEATAEWALHQAETAEMPLEDSQDYADDLPEFLRDPDVDLMAHASWTDTNDHEYGAFLLAEYLEERYGSDFIRRTWERVGDGDGLGAMEAVEDVLLNQEGETLAAILPDFWRRSYRLSPTADAYLDADYEDSGLALWRELLHLAGPPTAGGEPAEARPARQVFTLEGGAAFGLAGEERGGASFVDLVHDSGEGGQLEIELRNFEVVGQLFGSDELVPSSDDVAISLYSFAEYPTLCQAPILDLPMTGDGAVSEMVAIAPSCTFSTLVITHDNVHGDPKGQAFRVRLFEPWRNNAEGGTDEVVVTEANSGGASGDPFWSVGANDIRFDDDGPVTDGAMSYRFNGDGTDLSWYSGTEPLPPEFTTVFRVYLNDYPAVGAYFLEEVFYGYSNDSVEVQLESDGLLRLTVWDGDTSEDTVAFLSTPVPTGQWVRVEVDVLLGAARIRLYDSPHGGTQLDSTTAVVEDFGPANQGRDTVIGFWVWAVDGEENLVSPVWMDELEVFPS